MAYEVNIGPYQPKSVGADWRNNIGVDHQDEYDAGAPYWDDHKDRYSFIAGSTVEIDIPITASPAPTYQWYKNGASLPLQTSRVLSIASSDASDGGYYHCIATNTNGTGTTAKLFVMVRAAHASSPWHVNMGPYQPKTDGEAWRNNVGPDPQDLYGAGAPYWDDHKKKYVFFIGQTIEIDIPVTASPSPTYQWYRNGLSIPTQTSRVLSISGGDDTDGGTYHCVATNAAGASSTSKIFVAVRNAHASTYWAVNIGPYQRYTADDGKGYYVNIGPCPINEDEFGGPPSGAVTEIDLDILRQIWAW